MVEYTTLVDELGSFHLILEKLVSKTAQGLGGCKHTRSFLSPVVAQIFVTYQYTGAVVQLVKTLRCGAIFVFRSSPGSNPGSATYRFLFLGAPP